MKVLFISHSLPPKGAILKNIGGMQRVSLQLMETLQMRDDISIETIGQATSWKFIGVKTTWFLLKLFAELPVYVQRHKPDVILFSSMVTASLAPMLRNRIEIPMIAINHGQDVTLALPVYQWLVRKIFASLDGVISVSSATREACIARGMDPAKGIALPNGFMVQEQFLGMSAEKSRELVSKVAGKELKGRNLLLTTGRLVLRKGHDWFINEVMPKINTDVDYLILGDGPEMETILHSVLDSGYQDRVHLLGRQSDEILHAAYLSADVFVMPNIRVAGDMEGFGIVMLEANIAGTPVVASDLEGIKDVVENGRNGYKIPVGDSVQFASTIDEIFANGLPELSRSAREYVFERFTWERVAQQYLQYIAQVVVRFEQQQLAEDI